MGRDLKHIDFAAVSKALRSSSLAWNNAKIEYDQIVEVPYHSLVTKKRDGSDCRKVISQINSSLLQRINGGVNALIAKSFVIEYELRCNMDNDPIYGRIENFSLSFTVDWNVCHIDITCVPGPIDAVVVDADLRAMLNEGIVRNLKKFAGLTGLYPKQVRDTHKAAQLIKVFWHGLIGQSKVTRLVKGCLMYLERLEKGPAEFKAYRPNTLRYTVEDLLPTMDYGETAYVFTTNESGVSSNAILYGMCEEYPHPNFGGYEHISIPADGKTIYLVGYELEQFKTDVPGDDLGDVDPVR
ncbi:unnamed protein product [Cuscuta epithymum]|uniref:Capsid protein N-terminal domain-containing protein n=1 Tax=Cuscuta epithymum TaxID=186058 RepID=A0AAV0ENK2_9ASTE|nr:unnamed protein product [Cuscuta epithymum]